MAKACKRDATLTAIGERRRLRCIVPEHRKTRRSRRRSNQQLARNDDVMAARLEQLPRVGGPLDALQRRDVGGKARLVDFPPAGGAPLSPESVTPFRDRFGGAGGFAVARSGANMPGRDRECDARWTKRLGGGWSEHKRLFRECFRADWCLRRRRLARRRLSIRWCRRHDAALADGRAAQQNNAERCPGQSPNTRAAASIARVASP
jgi:hypothetical protein